MNIPVLIIIFNRPETTSRLLKQLELAKPPRLYIAADGPRENKTGEKELCEETRRMATTIDWPCEVKTLFREKNIGVDPGVESAVDWFFTNEESGIILEDDCIPHPDFLKFSSVLLEKYRNDEKIMMISGNNFQDGVMRGNGSYYFSRYSNTWGWATWKRAWQKYDKDMQGLPSFISENKIENILKEKQQKKYWLSFFKKLYNKKYGFWDAKWLFAIWNNSGICITPNLNLNTNIGFGKDATHTQGESIKFSVKSHPLEEIKHPDSNEIDTEADNYLFNKIYKVSLFKKIIYKLKSFI